MAKILRLVRYAVHGAAVVAIVVTMVDAQGRRGGPPGGRGGRGGRASANADKIETRSYRMPETNQLINYDLFVSTKVDRKKNAPLIVFLHGLNTPARRLMPFLIDEAERRGYIIAAPIGYSLNGWYGVNGPTSPNTTPNNLGELSEKDVLYVLDEMRRNFAIDERRIYLLGQSMGGAGVLYLGPKYRNVWAALGASAPALRRHQSASILDSIPKMPVIMIHGDADRAVPVEQTRAWVDRMNALGMKHEYHEIRGGGHSDGIPVGARRIFDFFDKHQKAAAADSHKTG